MEIDFWHFALKNVDQRIRSTKSVFRDFVFWSLRFLLRFPRFLIPTDAEKAPRYDLAVQRSVVEQVIHLRLCRATISNSLRKTTPREEEDGERGVHTYRLCFLGWRVQLFCAERDVGISSFSETEVKNEHYQAW
jgi:hypothetical protein